MAGAPVWAALEWRRARVWGSGMFQCGQSSIASGVIRGSMEVEVMLGVVRRARTGEGEGLGLSVVVVDDVVADDDVGGCFGCERLVDGEEVSGGCGEIFVAPREGEPGWEAASELKRSSSSFAKADLRLPGGREGVMVAVEAMVDGGVFVMGAVRLRICFCEFRSFWIAGVMMITVLQSLAMMIRSRSKNKIQR